MEFIKKLLTAIRGGGRELGEAVLDSQGIRIYEQEIEDAKQAIKEAENDLTGVMAKEMQAGREINHLEQDITKYEEKALAALDQENEELAGEIANKIAELEMELETQHAAKQQFSAHVEHVKERIKATHAKIREHEREIAMVKTADKVHKAAQSISQHMDGGSSKMVAAKETLERIKHRQQDESDRMAASESLHAEFSGQSLEKKLKAAGIGDDINRKKQVLERLKAKHKESAN